MYVCIYICLHHKHLLTIYPTRHCDGPASTTSPSSNEQKTDATEEAGPSPTESTGCHPHGDHWHCAGPASPTSGGGSEEKASATESGAGAEDTNAAGSMRVDGYTVAGIVGIAALLRAF